MPRKKETRNANGSGSIYQRADGRWEGKATIGYNPSNGKLIRKSVYGKTQSEVRKKIAEITVEIDKGTYKEPTKLKLAEWLEIWLNEYMTGLKPLTVKSYRATVNNHIIPALGNVRLTELNPHTVQTFINKLAEALSPKTVKNVHGVLHQGLSQAAIVGYIPSNPADHCKLPKVTKPKINPLDKGQISAFLDAIRGDYFESIYLVDLFTGMRQSEIVGLTWDCIDFDKGTITIYRQWQKLKGGYQFVSPKNNKSRVIRPPALVLSAIKQVRAAQLENQLRAGSAWENQENFVFTNELGQPLKHETIRVHFKKIATSIGLPDLRFHDLRHSFAVLSLQIGDDIKTVQENLGHHSAAFTLDTYAHVTDSMKEESASRLDRFIGTL